MFDLDLKQQETPRGPDIVLGQVRSDFERHDTNEDDGEDLIISPLQDISLSDFSDSEEYHQNSDVEGIISPAQFGIHVIPSEEYAKAPVIGEPMTAINPKQTALLLIEYQNDFVHHDGQLNTNVQDEMDRINMLYHSIALLRACREQHVKIIHAPITYHTAYESRAKTYGVLYNVWSNNAFGENTWGADFFQDLSPIPGEDIVKGKHGLDSFTGTNLDDILQASRITNLIICGYLTNCCVESTMRTGYEYGYNVFTVIDCCVTTSKEEHEYSL